MYFHKSNTVVHTKETPGAALESGCKQFASLDARQRECAKLEKLELHPAVFPRDVRIRKS